MNKDRVPVVPGDPKKMTPEDLLADIVEQLKKRYDGISVYTKGEIEKDNPKLKFGSLDTLCKKVVGMTAFQYLISVGVIKEIAYFSYRPVYISFKDLKDKKVCFVLEKDGEEPEKTILDMLQSAGATVVSYESDSIDYVCFLPKHPNGPAQVVIRKDPEDRRKDAFILMSQLESGKKKFYVIRESNLYDLVLGEEIRRKKSIKYSPENRAAMGLIVSNQYGKIDLQDSSIRVVDKISKANLPKIEKNEDYWTLRKLQNWYGYSGGDVSCSKTSCYSNKDFVNDVDDINKELHNYLLLCKNINNPKIVQQIISHADKNKDGSLSKNRVQYVAAFKYTCYTTKFYVIVARNVDKNTIVVNQELREFYCPGDTDYEFDKKLINNLDGVDPILLRAITHTDIDSNYEFRNMPGYYFIDSESGVIPEGSFANDPDIRYVEFSNRITEIGERAFYECHNLQSVMLGENVQILGIDSFKNCTALESVFLFGNLRKISSACFSGCSKLKTVDFGDSSICESIDYGAFSKCTSLRSVTVPDSVSKIASGVFDRVTPPVVSGFAGSMIEKYCLDKNIPFQIVEDDCSANTKHNHQ